MDFCFSLASFKVTLNSSDRSNLTPVQPPPSPAAQRTPTYFSQMWKLNSDYIQTQNLIQQIPSCLLVKRGTTEETWQIPFFMLTDAYGQSESKLHHSQLHSLSVQLFVCLFIWFDKSSLRCITAVKCLPLVNPRDIPFSTPLSLGPWIAIPLQAWIYVLEFLSWAENIRIFPIPIFLKYVELSPSW
jgi:hypothetical protein